MNDYYRKHLDRTDSQDPFHRLIPTVESRLHEYDRWDTASEEPDEAALGSSGTRGNTATLNIPDVRSADGCGCYNCAPLRRSKQLESLHQVEAGLIFLETHTEINSVWLSGGDCFALPTSILGYMLERLSRIDHVRTIRLESKLPVLYPMRISDDVELLDTIRAYSRPDRRIYVKAHIHHPRELTSETRQCLESLQQAGAVVVNHTPIWKGVNDDASVLGELLDSISQVGVNPYYLYVDNPEMAAVDVSVPLARAYRLVEEAKKLTTGFGKRVRLFVGHSSGRIEVLAIEHGKAYLKYVQSRDNRDGQFMIWDCPDNALRLDDHTKGSIEFNAANQTDEPAAAAIDYIDHAPEHEWTRSFPMRIIGD
jgi:KamA family protein